MKRERNGARQQADASKMRITPAAECEFPDPIPLEDAPPPELSPSSILGWLGDFVSDVAESLEVPYTFSAMHGLAAIATAAQGKFTVSVEPGYLEPLCVYVAACLPSGSRKSGVQRQFLNPFLDHERKLIAQHATEVKKISTRRQIMEAQVKAMKTDASSLVGPEFDSAMDVIHEREAALPEIPTEPRLITGDCTPEHLGTMLAQQSEKIAWWSDEAGLIETLGGRYSNGVANLDLFLQSWSGSHVRVDRGSRPSVILNHPLLTVMITPQPDALKGLADKPSFRGRGLTARFMYAVPQSNLGFRTLETRPIREGVATAYANYVTELLELPPRSENDRPAPYVLRLDSAAYRIWKDYQRHIEELMRPHGRLDGLSDLGGKLPGQAARIAGLLHCAEYAGDIVNSLIIRTDTMERAVSIASVCMEHALYALGVLGVDDSLDIARRLWKEVEKLDGDALSERDIWHPTRGKYPSIASVAVGFDVLVDRGWLIEDQPHRHGPGRPPKRKFRVNPKARSGHFGHLVSSRGGGDDWA